MSLEDYSKYIGDLERRYPVWSWTFGGLAIWPYLRTRLYLNYKKQLTRSAPTPRQNTLAKISFVLSAIPTTIRLLVMGRRDAVVLSNSAFRSFVSGKYLDRVCDPVMEGLRSQGKSAVLLEFASNFAYKRPRFNENEALSIQPVFILLNIVARVCKKQTLVAPGFEEFCKEPGISASGRMAVTERLALDAWWCRVWSWRIILKWLRTKYVFLNCYYDEKGISLTGAAAMMNIRSIDMQHGVQGGYHLAYAWSSSPEVKKKTVRPDMFMVWDEVSASNLIRGGCKAVVAGYPWIAWWKSGRLRIEGEVISHKIILYSLQPADDPFSADFMKSVSELPDDAMLYVRVHPHDLHQIDYFKRILPKHLSSRVEFEKASHLPLPYLLSYTILHITKWSTVTIESYYFNVPTLFVHPTGMKIFRSMIPEIFLYEQVTSTAVINAFENKRSAYETKGPDLNLILKEVMT